MAFNPETEIFDFANARTTRGIQTSEPSIPLSKLRGAFVDYIISELEFQYRGNELFVACLKHPNETNTDIALESKIQGQLLSELRIRALGKLLSILELQTGAHLEPRELQNEANGHFNSSAPTPLFDP